LFITMFYSFKTCNAVWYSVSQGLALYCSVLKHITAFTLYYSLLQCFSAFNGLLHYIAIGFSILRCITVFESVMDNMTLYHRLCHCI